MQGGGRDLVSHQEGAAQHLETAFQKHLGADARHGRGHGADERHAGGQGGADLVQHGSVLEAEHLGEDDEVLVLVEDADVRDDLLPVLVHRTGDVHRPHFAGTQPQMLHLRQAHEADPAGGARLLQGFGQERGVEVVEAGEIDDQGFLGHVFVGKDGDVVEGEGYGLELAHGHELEAVRGVRPHARRGEEGGHPFPDGLGVLETAGEEVHRILPGAHDGDFAARLLEADAGGEARQASADDHDVESHTPKTCL